MHFHVVREANAHPGASKQAGAGLQDGKADAHVRKTLIKHAHLEPRHECSISHSVAN